MSTPQPTECRGCGKMYAFPCHGGNDSCPNYQWALRHNTVPGAAKSAPKKAAKKAPAAKPAAKKRSRKE